MLEYIDKYSIYKKANSFIKTTPVTITQSTSKYSQGSKNEYYSNGDYWWPNPDTNNGLPYIRRDGQSNPNNFNKHRKIMNYMKEAVVTLAAAYKLSGIEVYAKKAIDYLYVFFIDLNTRMEPHLKYAQAIPGVCSGRGIGIIDTVHIMDIPYAIEALRKSEHMNSNIYISLKKWFEDYIYWLVNHEYGIEESNEKNNHSICYFAQLSSFAHFVNNTEIIEFCIENFKYNLIHQMSEDGSFKRELSRTKPYSYSYFTIDNMVALCQTLSNYDKNIWNYKENNRCIEKGLEFFVPYIENISTWPYRQDIKYFDKWPIASSMLLFGGLAFNNSRYLDLYRKMKKRSSVEEIERNITVKQPYLWILEREEI